MPEGLARLNDAWNTADTAARVAFLQGIYRRSAEGSGVLDVQALVGGASGEPMVELRWDDKLLQWSPEETRQHAMILLEAAEAAVHDGWFAAFVQERLEGTREQAMGMLLEMRAWRQRRAELPEDPQGYTG
jgi:hypothetical protein